MNPSQVPISDARRLASASLAASRGPGLELGSTDKELGRRH